jgi:ABC-type Fe3+/spermidine/putrescine transport system ATPase subunit
MIRVTLDGLVKRYDRIAVVDNASLEILPGELTVLLGPSGAGKTTLARLIAGLEPLDDGVIFFDQRMISGLAPKERRVGIVFQDDAVWPRLTVAQNVEYPLKVQHVPRAERRARVAEVLDQLRIDGVAGRYPETLSGLQRQRVGLARAMIGRPELLVLDEPLGRLETRVRDDFRDDVRRLHAESGAATLILTNDAREALALADRLAIMDLGRIVQVDLPVDVYNRPADAFVARLLGPTNLLQGHVDSSDSRGEVVVRTPFGRLVGRTSRAPIGPGTPVTVSIRPESLAIGPSIPPGWNRFAATIERLVFQGEVRRIHLRGPNDWPIVALALQSHSRNLREGQSLTLSVPPELVVVLLGNYVVATS